MKHLIRVTCSSISCLGTVKVDNYIPNGIIYTRCCSIADILKIEAFHCMRHLPYREQALIFERILHSESICIVQYKCTISAMGKAGPTQISSLSERDKESLSQVLVGANAVIVLKYCANHGNYA